MIPLSTRAASPVQSPFTAEQQKRFDEGFARAAAKYPPERRKAALLAALHLAQDELGWLPEPAMAYVGHLLDVPPVRVREVATFYTMYRLRPVGRHHIGVCNSVSCWAMGAEKILDHCAQTLGIQPGETTRDGHFSLEEVACLASCGTAPAVLVNNFRYVENVNAQTMDRLIEKLRGMPGQEMAPGPAPRLPLAEHHQAATTFAEAGSTERK
jgi:NADH-quinone oxidoreductase subunit E